VLTLLLDAVRQAGATLVLASHDARVVAAMAGMPDTTALELAGTELCP
jgi:ABC-type glutathione transport system ATPase component